MGDVLRSIISLSSPFSPYQRGLPFKTAALLVSSLLDRQIPRVALGVASASPL